jgi:hypothetical protein
MDTDIEICILEGVRRWQMMDELKHKTIGNTYTHHYNGTIYFTTTYFNGRLHGRKYVLNYELTHFINYKHGKIMKRLGPHSLVH